MKISENELTVFLNEANKNSYANKAAPKAPSSRDKSEDYHFEKGRLVYHDTYFGTRDFIGEEVVYKDGDPIWAMNYYGFINEPSVSTNGVYDFLRESMMQEYNDALPVRGPKEYKNGDTEYHNSIDGTLARFSGIEEIYQNDTKVYNCWYHGGSIE